MNVTEKGIVIENAVIKKEISVNDGKIAGISYFNKQTNKALKGKEGSEEFILSLKSGFRKKIINASELKILRTDSHNGVLSIAFESFTFCGCEIKAEAVYTLSDGDFFLKKKLILFSSGSGANKVKLDYIDFEAFKADAKNLWCLPEQKGSHIPGYALGLGQPVYADSFFFGVEFPACANTLIDGRTSLRYFNGRTFGELTGNGSFESYNAVVGCGDGDSFAQVQKAFFTYINTIAPPLKLRRQYNSWYDNMLDINGENVTASFKAIEKGLRESGEKPLDSYVVDDGWNDYESGFWSFNSKFPNGLKEFAVLTESFGSRFGLWLGPRGGYTTDTPKFAKRIQKAGNGYYNKASFDICVASEKYRKKTEELLCSFCTDYNINYLKLDGFAQRPCKNRRHDHMVGGYKNMYFYTDVWEGWLSTFTKLKENLNGDLFINLTCYAPPSPWFLKWVDSLWMQVSNDHGFIGDKNKVCDKDRMLTYRDDCYYDFYKVRQFQFPQRSLYNHDPIFGKSAKVSMTDEEFESFLYTCACRGTMFWELYYSHSLMNEAKWKTNHEVLTFIDENAKTLSRSVIFGGKPGDGDLYGYSCFDEGEGILCLRNPCDKARTFDVTLDEHIGVKASFGKKQASFVLPKKKEPLTESYGYGDKLSVKLGAFETVIIKL